MSIEELLKLRFQIIADFPLNRTKIGNIFLENEIDFEFEKYPHLYKKLNWWEMREKNEMPIFLKHTLSDGNTTYHKVKSWDLSNPKFIEWRYDNEDFGSFGMWADKFNYMPCSEEEYLSNFNKA